MNSAPIRLLLVDEDPVFRLGLRIWLEQTAGFQVVAEADSSEEAIALLQGGTPPSTAGAVSSSVSGWSDADDTATQDNSLPLDIDLVILDLGLGAGNPDRLPGLRLCSEIKTRYPALPILVLSSHTEPVLQTAAHQMGADGFGARGMPVRDLARLIQSLVQPQANAPVATPTMAPSGIPDGPSLAARPLRSPLAILRENMRRSALQQIAAAMAELEPTLRLGTGSVLYDAVLAGRYRELKAARWFIQRLLTTPEGGQPGGGEFGVAPGVTPGIAPGVAPGAPLTDLGTAALQPPRAARWEAPVPQPEPAIQRMREAIAPPERLALLQGDLQSVVLEGVFRKLQGPLENVSSIPLETDILRGDKKRELLFITLRKLEDALDELRQAQRQPGQLADLSPELLQDIWQSVVTDFFGRYYTLEGDTLEQPVVKTLLLEAPTVQQSILDKIPQVPMFLGHLLFQEPVVVEGSPYQATTPEAIHYSRQLLENLLLQVANGVIQPLLNRFADVEAFKKALYHRRMMTTREIERFRNDLSWRYRWDGLINEPKAIFESQYRLLALTERGIQTHFVYAPRRDELEQLSRLQRSVTLAIEARDAIAPRFRSTISFIGSGLVYVLTDVLGRGIGLIGRGILKGMGNAWSDPHSRRKGRGRES